MVTFPSSVYSVPYMRPIYAAMAEREAEAARARQALAAWRVQHPHHGQPGATVARRPAPRLAHAH